MKSITLRAKVVILLTGALMLASCATGWIYVSRMRASEIASSPWCARKPWAR